MTILPLSDEVVALKRLKMENEKEGFPITSLREINTLLKAQHPNIVTVRVSSGDPTDVGVQQFQSLDSISSGSITPITKSSSPLLGNRGRKQHGQNLHRDGLR